MMKIEGNLYNYISMNQKKITTFMDILFLVVIIIMFFYYKNIFNDENVSFYLFSTIVQGFLALVGFLGALTVFKIQLIENEAQKISTALESSVEMYHGTISRSYSWIEMMNESSKILEDSRSQWRLGEIKSGYAKLCKLRDEKSPIRNIMVDFSLITMVNIMVALFGILLSKIFISNELFLSNTFYALLALSLSYISIKIAFKLIRSCLGYSFSVMIK